MTERTLGSLLSTPSLELAPLAHELSPWKIKLRPPFHTARQGSWGGPSGRYQLVIFQLQFFSRVLFQPSTFWTVPWSLRVAGDAGARLETAAGEGVAPNPSNWVGRVPSDDRYL